MNICAGGSADSAEDAGDEIISNRHLFSVVFFRARQALFQSYSFFITWTDIWPVEFLKNATSSSLDFYPLLAIIIVDSIAARRRIYSLMNYSLITVALSLYERARQFWTPQIQLVVRSIQKYGAAGPGKNGEDGWERWSPLGWDQTRSRFLLNFQGQEAVKDVN